jgi:peptidoglycan/LPS O-acetylase OafA/YrhL
VRLQRVKELDGLRAIAILAVLGCHLPGFAGTLGGLPEFGWIGVDIFFALSGFLITTILLGLRNKSHPYKTFYSRRALRILPPYLAVIFTIVIIGILTRQYWVLSTKFLLSQIFFLQAHPKQDFQMLLSLIRHPRWYIQHFPGLLAKAHNLPPEITRGVNPWLIEAPGTYWSLSIEEYFYLLWAPVVLRCSRRNILFIAIATCVAEMTLRSFCTTPNLSYFGIFFRLDSLLYGALLALLMERWNRLNLPKWRPRTFGFIFVGSLAGLAVIFLAIGPVLGREIRQSSLFEVFGLPLISIATTALIGILLLKANSSWWFSRLLRTRIAQLIGTVSYTLYLVHVLAFIAVWEIGEWLSHTLNLRLPSFVIAVISTLLAIAIAKLSWHLLEKPILQWKDRHFPSTNVVSRTATEETLASFS